MLADSTANKANCFQEASVQGQSMEIHQDTNPTNNNNRHIPFSPPSHFSVLHKRTAFGETFYLLSSFCLHSFSGCGSNCICHFSAKATAKAYSSGLVFTYAVLICFATQSGQFHIISNLHEVGLTGVDQNVSACMLYPYNQSDK